MTGSLEAARLIEAALEIEGCYVRPLAVDGWVFTINPAGEPTGFVVAPNVLAARIGHQPAQDTVGPGVEMVPG